MILEFSIVRDPFACFSGVNVDQSLLDDLPNGTDIKSFISAFYAEDFQLYETVKAIRHTTSFLTKSAS